MLMNHIHRPSASGFPARWAEQAIAMAMENRWTAAVAANKHILSVAPEDVGALNRLGRASMELGQYEEAREAYARALVLSPSNVIAQKNLARVAALQADARPESAVAKLEPQMFLAEPGKAVVTSIKPKVKATALLKIAIGEQLDLVLNGRALAVRDAGGVLIGAVEQRLARRIIKLMEGGNRYEAALASAGEDAVRIVIRETYRDPSQFGKVSFPALESTARTSDLGDSLAADESDEEEVEVDDSLDETEEPTASVEEEAGSRGPLDEPYFA